MKLLRFITDSEAELLKELCQKPLLQNDNHSDYYHAEKMKDDPDVMAINALLKETIEDFASFTNFVKAAPNLIRIQYIWDHQIFFKGVGYVTITELRDGFGYTCLFYEG